MDWESYYARSLARRGSLRPEDCYCPPAPLLGLLQTLLPASGASGASAGPVLLVGAGASELPALLAEERECTAVDISPSCVQWMRQAAPKVEWVEADARQLPAEWANRFALVLDKGLLAHLATEGVLTDRASQCEVLLREYERVLKPGGQTVIVSLWPLQLGVFAYQRQIRDEAFGEALVYLLSPVCPWVAAVESGDNEVLVKTTLSCGERKELELHMGAACCRLVRSQTCESFELSFGCFAAARWTKDGLRLSR
ncbi:unnamed protein product [Effrenium voratum]|nr:unnamed protein product [Effrenium voratum]